MLITFSGLDGSGKTTLILELRDVLLRHCDQLGDDAEMLEPVFGLFLVAQSVREGRKLERCSRLERRGTG